VGARENRDFVLPSSGFKRNQRVGALNKLQLVEKRWYPHNDLVLIRMIMYGK
jgi:hypothetical protein